jgi:hypothetical protein
VKLASGTNEYTVNFKFVPKDEGVRKFTVKVQQLPGEVTHQNNQKSFYVKVLKGRYKVLIISGAPSPDLAFIKRALVENKNYEVISYTEKREGNLLRGILISKMLNQPMCLFLLVTLLKQPMKKF